MTELLLAARTIAGALLLAVATGALLAAARSLTARLIGSSAASVQWVGCGLLAAGLLVALSLPLLFLGCYQPLAVTGAAVALAFAARRWVGPLQLDLLWLATGHAVRAFGRSPVAVFVVAGGGFTLLFAATRGLLTPPLSWDSLTYHMTIPAFWVQLGGYGHWGAPDAWQDYCRYPCNGELFVGWLLLPWHNDLLVNLTNMPFLLLLSGAIHALARELGASRTVSLVAALLVVLTPPCFAYATTQYVDIQVAAEIAAGWLFLARFLRTGSAADCLLAAIGFGLAAGTKHLGLVSAAIGSTVAVAATVLQPHCRPLWRKAAPALLVGLAIGAPWYVRNWFETDNPIYPFGMTLFGQQLFVGSHHQAAPPPPAQDFDFLAQLLGFPAGLLPLTYGPKAVWAALGGAFGIWAGIRGRRRGTWLALGLAVLADLAVFFSPAMKTLRVYWGEISQRLLLPPFALLICAGAVLATRWQGAKRRVWIGVLSCLVVWDIAAMHVTTGVHELELALVVAGLLAAAAGGTLFWQSRPCRLLRGPAVVAAAVLGLTLLCLLQWYRERSRHDYFGYGIDLPIPRRGTVGWRAVDDPGHGRTIAFAAGWLGWGHHWLVYPLFGSRLQNRLVYVPWTLDPATASYRPEMLAQAPAPVPVWIDRLRQAGVELLYLSDPPPPELAWVQQHPETFKLWKEGEAHRIFELR